jgi:putative ABC transport system permease protein
MRLFHLITWRSLRVRRLRSLLTLFGILLGVASIYAINATNQNAFRSITQLFAGTTGRVNLEVRNAANVGGVPESLRETITSVNGVQTVVAILKVPAALPGDVPDDIDLNFFGAGAGGLVFYGIDPISDPEVRDYRVTEGRFIRNTAQTIEVVLVEAYARDQSIEVGQTIQVLTAFGPMDVRVVGLLAKEGAGLTNMGKFGIMTLTHAQSITQRPDDYDQYDILTEGEPSDTAHIDSVRQALIDRLGSEYSVVYPASQGDRMIQMLSGYQIGLNFMAGIALFIGAFLIYNAFSMTVIERTRELGLMRCVGMTQRQVTVLVLLEGLVVGSLGALAGAGTGILLSIGLTSLMAEILGQSLEVGSLDLPLLIGSALLGLVVTVLASMIPARQAGRISPLEALRIRGQSSESRLVRFGWIFGVILLVVSTAILIWNPFPYDVQFRMGSLTVFLLFFGAMLIIPVTLSFWQFITRWPFKALFKELGELGARNLDRAKKRTMLTCAALLIGVSMVVVTQGMTSSFTADLYAWMDAYIGGDLYVSAPIPLNLEVQKKLDSVPGVAAVAPIRYINITWIHDETEENLSFMAVDPETYLEVARFVFTDDTPNEAEALNAFRQGGAVLISSVIAEKYGLQPGDTLEVKTVDSSAELMIAGVILDFYNQGLTVTGSWSDMTELFNIDDATTFFIKVDPNRTVSSVKASLEAQYQTEYQLVIVSNEAVRERVDTLMAQTFSMFDVLGILAVMVAALSVMNTLSMSVTERTREIGLLRSLGMTRSQTIRMILAEASLLGVIGGILGLGFGILLIRIFLSAMGAMSGYDLDFVLPVRTLWMSPILALITSQIAALIPAIRGAKTPILSAIHYE